MNNTRITVKSGTLTNISNMHTIVVHSKGNLVDVNQIPWFSSTLTDIENPMEDVMYVTVAEAELNGNPVELLYCQSEIDEYDEEEDKGLTTVVVNPNIFIILKPNSVENSLNHKENNSYELKKGVYFPDAVLSRENIIEKHEDLFTFDMPVIASAPFTI